MKKLISIAAAAFCILGLCSCGGQTPKPDTEIIGKWLNSDGGYSFSDTKATVIIDFSERGHFTSDGAFQTLNALIPAENVSYDGSRLYCTTSNYSEEYQEEVTSVLLDMERKDDPNPDSFNGEYKIYGGIATDLIARDLGISTTKLNFEGIVKDEKLYINIVDVFDYSAVDGILDFTNPYLVYADPEATSLKYTYSIDGDTLKMKFSSEDSVEEIYKISK